MGRFVRFPRHLGMSAVPAMVALLALVLLPACGHYVIPGDTTCDSATQWHVPANNVGLDDLAMVAPDEGWALGALTEQWPPASPGQGPAGIIFHLAHGQWQRLPQLFPGAELSTISMDSPADGWAASAYPVTGMGDRALVLHYTGGQWHPVDVPALDAVLKGPPGTGGGSIGWVTVQMFGPDAGWMFGETNLARDPHTPMSGPEVVILRFEHGVWTPIPAPSVTTTTTIFSLSAVSADEAWIVGTDYGHGSDFETIFAHYVDGAWSSWPRTFPGITDRFTMLSPSDGWAFASDPHGGGHSHLLHFDGATWAPVATPAAWPDQQVELLASVFSVSPGELWFPATQGGDIGAKSLIEGYSNGQWRRIVWPFTDVDAYPLRLVAVSPGELRGIGNIGHQEGCAPEAVFVMKQGVFLHLQQGNWTEDILP